MKQGPQIATAVAIGYALGRSRRMKLALMVGGVVLGRRMGDPKELLAKAGNTLSPSGELRDRLVDAAKTAAVAAASSKLDSLGDNLSERAAKIRSPQSDSSESEDEETKSTSSEQDESGSEQEQPSGEKQERTSAAKSARPPRKPSAPRAASTTPRKKAAASSSSRSGGNDG
ncbi:hypothetical protein QFW96_17145 [Saccharopolyspora sp. TS4A08]|uniref:DUF1490 family protein n=1 Tax=Saccharopolyspora ipomoeae TaxID=3042027 RepID=A0ABT6PRA9_9PSEU|nr:hypothetical protein [Saccharopolyspora sp. TS4A08]MDI2030360.1 hypothetical protein [Saccharopolyspora sp. TS4A08]